MSEVGSVWNFYIMGDYDIKRDYEISLYIKGDYVYSIITITVQRTFSFGRKETGHLQQGVSSSMQNFASLLFSCSDMASCSEHGE